MAKINLKRVYNAYEESDGFRILVDRLWPRGIKKENAHVDLWLKEIAPTNELRKWFGHDPAKWDGFQEKYLTEIEANKAVSDQLLEAIKNHKKVTIIYGAKDEIHNQAVVIHNWLNSLK